MKFPALLLSFSALLLSAHAQFTLVETGGTFRTGVTNIAIGATATSTGEYGAPHFTYKINDGLYGNSNSWLGAGFAHNDYIALSFATPVTIASFAFGRDNTGGFVDRSLMPIIIEYSTDYVPGDSLFTGTWITVGTLDYFSSPPPSPSFRHLYNLDTPLTGVTGFRLSIPAPANPVYGGGAIDELELYATSAIPEPSTYALLAGAAVLSLTIWRRRGCRTST